MPLFHCFHGDIGHFDVRAKSRKEARAILAAHLAMGAANAEVEREKITPWSRWDEVIVAPGKTVEE